MPEDAGGSPALVLFDLDGTLVDSGPGIRSSIAHATTTVGVPVPDPGQMRALIGPPFPGAFVDVLGHSPAVAGEIFTAYRAVYSRTGLYDVAAYPGVAELLGGLRAAGLDLAVTTSKRADFAREVVRHVGLDGYLDAGVFGADDGAVEGKAAVVALALAATPGRRVLALVGDRHHDVEGAHAHGLTAIGVTWGFGDAAELEAAGAEHVVDTAAGLGTLLVALDTTLPALALETQPGT